MCASCAVGAVGSRDEGGGDGDGDVEEGEEEDGEPGGVVYSSPPPLSGGPSASLHARWTSLPYAVSDGEPSSCVARAMSKPVMRCRGSNGARRLVLDRAWRVHQVPAAGMPRQVVLSASSSLSKSADARCGARKGTSIGGIDYESRAFPSRLAGSAE